MVATANEDGSRRINIIICSYTIGLFVEYLFRELQNNNNKIN